MYTREITRTRAHTHSRSCSDERKKDLRNMPDYALAEDDRLKEMYANHTHNHPIFMLRRVEQGGRRKGWAA